MHVEIIQEAGAEEALFGLGLSYGLTSGRTISDVYIDTGLRTRLMDVAGKLAHKGGGHNKYLRQVSVWIDVSAPLYFWQEMATYGVGNTFQSESTMHGVWKKDFTHADFEGNTVDMVVLDYLNCLAGKIREDDITKEMKDEYFFELKRTLPSGYIQRRVMSTNYLALQNIVAQRKNHRLPEWRVFIDAVREGVIFRNWIFKPEADKC